MREIIKYKSENILDLIWLQVTDPIKKIHFYEGFENTYSLSYAEIWQYAYSWKLHYQNHHVHGTVVISLPTGPEFLGAFLGAMMAGLIPVPVVSADVASSRDYSQFVKNILHSCAAQFIVCDSGANFKQQNVFALPVLKYTQNNSSHGELQYDFKSQVHTIAFLQYSSGSTSLPKGVILEHKKVLINLEQITDAMSVTEQDVLCSWLPVYHDMGLIGGLLGPIYCSIHSHYHSPVDFIKQPLAWFRFVSFKKATILLGPDFMYKLLARCDLPESLSMDLSKLRICMTGSEPVSLKTCHDFVSKWKEFGLQNNVMMPVYGMAEAVLGVAFSPISHPLEYLYLNRSHYEKGIVESFAAQNMAIDASQTITSVSCGKPLKGIEVQIRDENNQTLPEDRVGEIYFLSPAGTSGYYHNSSASQELIHERWIKTGDIGFLHNKNLFISGRRKDIIIYRGRKIHPIDLEAKVMSLSSHIGRAVVVSAQNNSQRHDQEDESIYVFVEIKSLFFIKTNELKVKISNELQQVVMVSPEQIYLMPERSLPRTSSGKMKRYELKKWIAEGVVLNQQKMFLGQGLKNRIAKYIFLAKFIKKNSWSQDPLRTEILQIFSEISAVSKKDIRWDKEIISYGLDSLKLVGFLTHLESKYGKISILDFYKLKTLNDVYNFCVLIQSKKNSPSPEL